MLCPLRVQLHGSDTEHGVGTESAPEIHLTESSRPETDLKLAALFDIVKRNQLEVTQLPTDFN